MMMFNRVLRLPIARRIGDIMQVKMRMLTWLEETHSIIIVMNKKIILSLERF